MIIDSSLDTSSAFGPFGGITGGSGGPVNFPTVPTEPIMPEVNSGGAVSRSFAKRIGLLSPIPFLSEMSRFGLDPLPRNDASTTHSLCSPIKDDVGIIDLFPPDPKAPARTDLAPVDSPAMLSPAALSCGASSVPAVGNISRALNGQDMYPNHNGLRRAK